MQEIYEEEEEEEDDESSSESSSYDSDGKDYFALLSKDVIVYILRKLSVKQILDCSVVCRRFHHLANNVFLWMDLFRLHYPSAQYCAKTLDDWKFTYMCQVQGVSSSLKCFHSKEGMDQQVLGFGVIFSENPKTGLVDYIDCLEDTIISASSFYKRKVRVSSRGEKMMQFLPLYLTEQHFVKAIPYLKKVASRLSDLSFPYNIVDMLCKTLNTLCVLLADKGVLVSNKALGVYTQVHRLLLGVCSEFPVAQRYIDERVRSFLASDSNRDKACEPSIGNFLPLLSVTTVIQGWKDVALVVVKEIFARNVLWICRHKPSLRFLDSSVRFFKNLCFQLFLFSNFFFETSQKERLEASFEGSVVSNKLLAFQAFFISSIGRPKGVNLQQVRRNLDRYFGEPLPSLQASFRQNVTAIVQMKDWPALFAVLGMRKCPSKEFVEKLLKDSVRLSKKKRYHTDRTRYLFLFLSSFVIAKSFSQKIPQCSSGRNFCRSSQRRVLFDGKGCDSHLSRSWLELRG